MKIELLIDSVEKLSAKEPVGCFLLHSGLDEIRSEYTYLDAWLICLIKGLDKLKDGEPVEIEFPEQPEPMVMTPIEEGILKVEYYNEMVLVDSVEIFTDALRKAVERFVNLFREQEGYSDNTFFEILEDFMKGKDAK